MARLFEKHIEPGVARPVRRPRRSGSACSSIPDEELWAARSDAARVPRSTSSRDRARQRWTDDQAGGSRIVAARRAARTRRHSRSASRVASRATSALTCVFRDPDRLARSLNGAGRSRAVRVRWQGAPGRRRRQAPSADHLPTCARSAGSAVASRSSTTTTCTSRSCLVQGCDVWLNTPRKAARGQRHERHEGVDERRAAPEHRATAGGRKAFSGTNGWQIVGHTERRRSEPSTRPMRSRSTTLLGERGRAGVLRPRRARTPPPLARDGQAGDPDDYAAILGTPDVQGIRRAGVRAGDSGDQPARPSCCRYNRSRWPGSLPNRFAARSAARKRSPSRAATNATATTAGTRRSRSRTSSRVSSRSSATSALTARRNISSITRRRSGRSDRCRCSTTDSTSS